MVRTHPSQRGTGFLRDGEFKTPDGDGPRLRLQVGKMVPGTRYQILSWLGEGGMGVVYLAEHADIGRKVALKILRFDLSQQSRAKQVFRDEARAASKIGSRHIVDIFDFGELEDGRLFFCMEVVQGGDLVLPDEQSWIEPTRLIPILRQTCKGLHAAHKANIVHRDIKPENILITTREGRPDAVKLLDFGISAMLSAGSEGTRSIAGTPFYMAPEQINGEAFDGRLDIYAVGCMAFELLAGRPPFLADEMLELLRKQAEEIPPTFAELVPNRNIPACLEAVVRRCLEKDPNNRYRDMADLEAALCEVQIELGLVTAWDDLPVPTEIDDQRRADIIARMPNPLDLGRDRRRAPVWIAASLAAAVVATAAIWIARPTPSPDTAPIEVIERLVTDARGAAARQNYVFSPRRDSDATSAYRSVLELESLEGPAGEAGKVEGKALREEFAASLVAVGDRFWEDEATRPVAREYYLWSLLFDESQDQAFERAAVSLGQFADFREKARAGMFTDGELLAGQFAGALAIEDTAERDAILVETFENPESQSLVGRASRARAVRRVGASRAVMTAIRETNTDAIESAPAGDDTPADPASDAEGTGTGTGLDNAGADEGTDADATGGAFGRDASEGDTTNAPRTRKSTRASKRPRDPARANELARQGLEALRAGNRNRASQLFHQALSFDQRSGTALMGLSDVYFDTGRHQQAVSYAEKAVRASPRNASFRLKLGDALFKVLRYQDAMAEYTKAKNLGSSRAQARIEKLKAKLGN